MNDFLTEEDMTIFEPISLTPEQGLFVGAQEIKSGHIALRAAVLESAIFELIRPCRSFREHRLFGKALRWINEEYDQGEFPPLCFTDCCRALRLDPDYIREGLEKKIQHVADPDADRPTSRPDIDPANWRRVFGGWGERYAVSLHGLVFDLRRELPVSPKVNAEDFLTVYLRTNDLGNWRAPVARLVARTWGGANRHVQIAYLDQNTHHCAFENLTWDGEKYGGTPGQVVEVAQHARISAGNRPRSDEKEICGLSYVSAVSGK